MSRPARPWKLKTPLVRRIGPAIGRSPHDCEDCGQAWIFGPTCQFLMHYCQRPRGRQSRAGKSVKPRFIYTDLSRAAFSLEAFAPPPKLTVVEAPAITFESSETTLATAS